MFCFALQHARLTAGTTCSTALMVWDVQLAHLGIMQRMEHVMVNKGFERFCNPFKVEAILLTKTRPLEQNEM